MTHTRLKPPALSYSSASDPQAPDYGWQNRGHRCRAPGACGRKGDTVYCFEPRDVPPEVDSFMDPKESIKLSGLVGLPGGILRSESLRSDQLEHRPDYAIIPRTIPNHADRKVLGSLMNGSAAPIRNRYRFHANHGWVSTDHRHERSLGSTGGATSNSQQTSLSLNGWPSTFLRASSRRPLGKSTRPSMMRNAVFVEALDLDQSSLFQVEGEADLLLTHHWERPGNQPPPLPVSAREQFPWTLAKILNGNSRASPPLKRYRMPLNAKPWNATASNPA